MFTGIIEEVGTVKQITHGQHSEVLNIQARTVLENTKIGDSIAVNGICLTVTRLFADSFSADVMHETLNRSSLAGLMVGSRSIWNGQWLRMDGSAGILWRVMWMAPVHPANRKRRQCGLVYHPCGTESFALCRGKRLHRGRCISLTVAEVSSDAFSVSTIPHTVSCTNLCQRHKNDVVNLETDILGKYVEKLFQPIPQEHRQSSVTKEMLIRYGFE